MDKKLTLEISGLTDAGVVREHNEDAIGSAADIGLVILADGMGGHNAGEVASAMAVEGITDSLRHSIPETDTSIIDEESGYTHGTLLIHEAILKTNSEIFQVANDQPQCQGMGTTLVAALFYNDRVTIANVGDSRLYRFRAGQLEQLTSDHTLLQELVDRGFYSQEEAEASLNRNVITRALGTEPAIQVDLQEEIVLPGDLYMICSDGLNDMVPDEKILSTLSMFGGNLDKIGEDLIRQANSAGGRDNVSVILIRPKLSRSSVSGWLNRIISWFD